jgi:hypothetical protein
MDLLYRRSHFVNNFVLIGVEGVVLLSYILSVFSRTFLSVVRFIDLHFGS